MLVLKIVFLGLFCIAQFVSCSKSTTTAAASGSCDPSTLTLGLPLQNFSTLSGDFLGVPYGVADTPHAPGGHSGVDLLTTTQYNVIAPAAGTVRGIVDAEMGRSLQIDLGVGNCSLRLTHITEILVSDGAQVTEGQLIAKMVRHTTNTSRYFFHYELTGVESSLTFGGGNTAYSLCPFLYSSDATKTAARTVMTSANTAIKAYWATQSDALMASLGNASANAGLCYTLALTTAASPTFP